MKAKSELHCLVSNLKELLPIANSHLVHFITRNSFERMIPKYLQDEIMSLDMNEMNQLVLSRFSNDGTIPRPTNSTTPHLISFLNDTQKLSLKHNSSCLSFEDLLKCIESKVDSGSSFHISKHLMSMKKSHEVEIMSAIVAAIAKGEKCTHIIDVGGGKGYLSSVLALKHELKVLSVDSSLVTSKGAERQMPKIEKLWMTFQKKSASSDTSNMRNATGTKESKKYSELFKIATNFITENTNVIEILNHSFPEDELGNVMLAGLHTCGNLAASSIHLFLNNPKNVRCLVNVGCCYNLMTEEFNQNPCDLEHSSATNVSGVGFPMSAYLRDEKFVLGRNARMLATQPPDRMCHEGTVETDVLFYRALLELYLEKKLGSANGTSQFKVGKLKRKCSSFNEYVHKSIERLGIHIQGIQDAHLVQLFDPVVSPRCFSIVAFNRPKTNL
ncbi:probable methyltransferase-like protein 25 isoform X2 [Macrosteles quadrilineatus]|uniref:probable methyltransferase-like protein 25 isoform X2 n=1 Tax=Macrosteles quadrilineatus TaxID=74068 RepID=UPI0023E19CF2|nr:probable methyltransferase-like protein 25 isoform X2 [Macrosteles quadrilineatus]